MLLVDCVKIQIGVQRYSGIDIWIVSVESHLLILIQATAVKIGVTKRMQMVGIWTRKVSLKKISRHWKKKPSVKHLILAFVVKVARNSFFGARRLSANYALFQESLTSKDTLAT